MKKGRKKGHRNIYSIFIRKLLLKNCYAVDSNGKFGTFIVFTIDILHKTDSAQNCTHFLILIYLKICISLNLKDALVLMETEIKLRSMKKC